MPVPSGKEGCDQQGGDRPARRQLRDALALVAAPEAQRGARRARAQSASVALVFQKLDRRHSMQLRCRTGGAACAPPAAARARSPTARALPLGRTCFTGGPEPDAVTLEAFGREIPEA